MSNAIRLSILMLTLFWYVTPLVAAASTHTYTCADSLQTTVGVTCSSDVFTWANNADNYTQDETSHVFQLTNGTGYYLTAKLDSWNGHGSIRFCITGDCGTTAIDLTSTVHDQTFVGTGGYMAMESTSDGTYAQGNISFLCISTSPNVCPDPSTPTPPPTEINNYVSSSTCQTVGSSTSCFYFSGEVSDTSTAQWMLACAFGIFLLSFALTVQLLRMK